MAPIPNITRRLRIARESLYQPLVVAVVAISALTLSCKDQGPSTGTLRVVVATASATSDRDVNGYSLVIDGDTIGVGSDVTISRELDVGEHIVRLEGIATNCSITGESEHSVEVVGGDIAFTTFNVSCNANVGTLQITTVTSGILIESNVLTSDLPGVGAVGLLPNGTHTFANVRAGTISVRLDHIAPNCTLEGLNPQIVTLPFQGTVEVVFTIHCGPPAAIRIIVETSGAELDSDGYQVQVRPVSGGAIVDRSLPANGNTVISPIAPGNYLLAFSSLSANCGLVTPNPQAAVVLQGIETSVTARVTCEAGTRIAYTVGLGPSDIYVSTASGGQPTRLTAESGANEDAAWSADGTKIVFASSRDSNFEIYVMNADGSNQVRLTDNPAADSRPAWSPDGSHIAFVSQRDGLPQIYVMKADGTDVQRLTTVGKSNSPDWSPDGTQIAFQRDDVVGSIQTAGIWIINANGSGLRQLTTTYGDAQPAWSPNGSRIAFARSAGSTVDLYVADVNGSSFTQLTADLPRLSDPAWSPDGRKIAVSAFAAGCDSDYYYYYYESCVYQILVVDIDRLFHSFSSLTPAFNPAWRR